MSLSFNASKGSVTVNDQSMTVPPGTNVLLIDRVDTAGGPVVVKTLAVPHGPENLDPRFGSLAPFFSSVPELRSYLRCEETLPALPLPAGAPPEFAVLREKLSRGICAGFE